ncbi:MAG: class I SAM-dependent methyltransferase [Pyrinomonadaceae bacterium]
MSAGTEPDVTGRFSSRVDYYIKYRPRYPHELIDFLKERTGLSASSIIADVGSGTGVLSEMFLKNGNPVYGVEPNREMRGAAEKLLEEYPDFSSVAGSAESTTLADRSVDFVTAGQAFHWFDLQKSREEFLRILRPDGWTVLVWNNRRPDTTPFLRAYESFLYSCGIDYKEVNHRNVDEKVLSRFFGDGSYQLKVFDNVQVFDYEGLKGRVLSSSYMPMEGHPKYEPMIAELEKIFHQHQTDGKVTVEYDTEMYYGRIE